MSIRLRLTIWYSSILALTLVVSGVVVYIFLSHYLIANQKEHMEQYSKEIIPKLSVIPWNWNELGQKEYIFDFQPLDQFQYPGFFIQIVDKDLEVEYPYKKRATFPVPSVDAAAEQKDFYKTYWFQYTSYS